MLTSSYKTTVATAMAGGEQRARKRNRPRYALEYTIASLSIAEFSVRRSNYIKELQSPVVVPIWTHFYSLTSMTGSNTANFAEAMATKKFKKDSYAYFTQGSNASFRLITAIGSNSITFAAGSFPTYTAGALVYPCIFGQHKATANGFDAKRLNETDEAISIEEL